MKKIISLLLALVMVLSLAACGAKEEAPAETKAPEAAADKVEVTMIAAQHGTETANWWAEFEKKFEVANADIDLTVDVVSWNDIYTVVNTRIANGEQPNLLNIDGYADYYNEGLLLPAKDWVSEETYAKFYESFLAESVDEEGTVWAVPDLASCRALYYNVDILNEVGVEVPTTETRYDLQDLFAAGKLAMMIAPTQIESICAEAGNNINFKACLIPCNEGKSNASMGVMDRVMCFDNGYTEEELAAITKVVDAFYDDEPYAEWVLMENFIPATKQGGDLCIAADPAMADWIGLVAGAQFYPAAKIEWIDVKLGVIDAQQRILLGEDAQTVLDELQAKIAG